MLVYPFLRVCSIRYNDSVSTSILVMTLTQSVWQGHSQAAITLEQGRFGKQPTIDRSQGENSKASDDDYILSLKFRSYFFVNSLHDRWLKTFVPMILLCVTPSKNVATVNSSVPDSWWWSMWQTRRWCDTWDPDHGLEGPSSPLSSWVPLSFEIGTSAWEEAISIRYFLRP